MFALTAQNAPCVDPGWSVSPRDWRGPQASLSSSVLPMTQRATLIAEFSEVVTECSEPGWSGERSDPIASEAIAAGYKLISQLPEDLPSPSVGAIPEGLLSFEWYRSPKRVVMVVTNANNGVDYAIRRGDEVFHGSAPFFGKLPETVLSQIRALA